MSGSYFAGFDVSTIATGTLTLSAAGATNIVITLSNLTASTVVGSSTPTSSKFFHYQVTSTGVFYYLSLGVPVVTLSEVNLTDFSVSPYPRALKTAIRAAIVSAGDWPSASTTFDVTVDRDTGLYTLSYDSTFAMAFSDSVGSDLLGFSTDQSGASSYTGDQVPTYVVIPTVPGAHDPSPRRESQGLSVRTVTTDGTGGYGLARSYAPWERDWVQPFETKAKTLRLAAASTHPWTFQALVEHCRTVLPFVVWNGSGETHAETFFFRPDGAYLNWAAIRSAPTSDAAFNIPFACMQAGYVFNSG